MNISKEAEAAGLKTTDTPNPPMLPGSQPKRELTPEEKRKQELFLAFKANAKPPGLTGDEPGVCVLVAKLPLDFAGKFPDQSRQEIEELARLWTVRLIERFGFQTAAKVITGDLDFDAIWYE